MNDTTDFWTPLRECSWQQHLGRLLGLLWMLVLLQLLLPRAWGQAVLQGLPALIGLALMLKEYAERHETWGRASQLRRAGAGWRRSLRVLFAAEWRGWLRTFWGWQWEALRWPWRRKVLATSMTSESCSALQFGYLARSGYRGLMPMLLSSSVVDLVLLHAILGLGAWSLTTPQALAINLGNLLLHLLAFSCLWGDARSLGAGAHRLDAQYLHIALGLRASGRIPLQAIRSAERIGRHERAGDARIASRRCLRISPLAKPNLRLHLESSARVGLWAWGSWRPGLQQVELYVDEPDALLRALAR